MEVFHYCVSHTPDPDCNILGWLLQIEIASLKKDNDHFTNSCRVRLFLAFLQIHCLV